jgi:hypothetical protein
MQVLHACILSFLRASRGRLETWVGREVLRSTVRGSTSSMLQ